MRSSLLFKHPSFEDEGEWRLIVGYSHHSGKEESEMLANVKFRSAQGIVKPYMDFVFTTGEIERRKVLPLKNVMYGPTLRPLATSFSVDFFLRERGYGHVVSEKSKVPLEA